MACKRKDLVQGRTWIVLWGLPALAILVGVFLPSLRTWLWAPAFFCMGVACIANAARCRRLHCHITGPIFLLAAIATAFDLISPATILISSALVTLLAFLLERIRGRYLEKVSC